MVPNDQFDGVSEPPKRKSSLQLAETGLSEPLPVLIDQAGPNARFAYEEFFHAKVRNRHTRRAYRRAVVLFLDWCADRHRQLQHIMPADVGKYLEQLSLSVASRKQVLAALRHFFDGMVTRHAIPLNPALSVRGERYQVLEGKTPEITIRQARRLLSSIDEHHVIGMRDKAIISILIYTAARIGAVAQLRRKDLYDSGDQYCLHFVDKGGKSREIPVRHDLQRTLRAYLHAADSETCSTCWSKETPLFRTIQCRTGKITDRPMTDNDMARMIKRRMRACGLPPSLSPHSFRVTTITDLLSQGVPLEDVQHLAGHADPRTTRLYDRRQKAVTRNIVERISI